MKMKLQIALIALVVIGACSTKDQPPAEEKDVNLEGSWHIIAQIDRDAGKTEWEDFGNGLIYQKHLTPTHFTWLAYDPENDELVGAGGGSYTVEGSTYTEHIEFFHPVGFGLIGQSIPFEARIEDGVWFHTGSSPLVEFDPELAEMVVFDTTHIEEKWVKISEMSNANEMVKTWHLVNYKQDEQSTYDTYPEFVGYMKLLTPSHFVWVKYNKGESGGEITALGSGTWMFDGSDSYIENIQIMHPSGSRQVGTIIDFDYKYEEDKWYHHGYVQQMEDGVPVDSTYVDEIWIAEE